MYGTEVNAAVVAMASDKARECNSERGLMVRIEGGLDTQNLLFRLFLFLEIVVPLTISCTIPH